MSFEILERDLLARIGRLETKSGKVETPLLLPVVNPTIQLISPKEMRDDFGCQALIANAYLIKKNFEEEAKTKGIHDFLEFPGVVATDSGAYQILVYGEVDTTPEEIAKFEEDIDADIAVILDVPTGWDSKRDRAEWTVEETLQRARLTLNSLTRKGILWVGPIQGGNHLDLVAHSAMEIGKMPFQIYALGSPTQVLERYTFDFLVDMIMTAKENLPIEKPLHLFGAGHPFMFAFAVALGCDMFDSAAYAIYARQQKYMTDYGTAKLGNLEYFPCTCDVCTKYSPQELREASSHERERLLARHNLHAGLAEIRKIKQAIKDGRLWELLEVRARGHPSLLQALKRMQKYPRRLERYSPVSRERGIFYFDSIGLARPEIIRHRKRLTERYVQPEKTEILVLLPQSTTKPFHRSREHRRALRLVCKAASDEADRIHVCTYAAPFGIVPSEIDDVYPLSQFELSFPLDEETMNYVSKQVEDYIVSSKYKLVVLHRDPAIFEDRIDNACRKACSEIGIELISSPKDEATWNKKALESLTSGVSRALKKVKSRSRS